MSKIQCHPVRNLFSTVYAIIDDGNGPELYSEEKTALKHISVDDPRPRVYIQPKEIDQEPIAFCYRMRNTPQEDIRVTYSTLELMQAQENPDVGIIWYLYE